jgi:hypothetical protein
MAGPFGYDDFVDASRYMMSTGLYPRPYQPPMSERDEKILARYRELRDLAYYVGRGRVGDTEDTIQTLAMIDLKEEIARMPRSVERTTERVVVGDPINEAMSEVYKP